MTVGSADSTEWLMGEFWLLLTTERSDPAKAPWGLGNGEGEKSITLYP
jgi:hypothetical protein